MKKIFLFALICLMAVSIDAQRCAVLEFKAGTGISQTDVDGISAIFITYFRPAGYTMVERTQIDKAIDEQGFQRSKMTERQMVRIGEILNVSKIVVGDINVVMGQYNVDARVINVENGIIVATEGATFAGTSYRTTMQSIAQKLASQISISSGGIANANQSQLPIPKFEYVDLGLPSGTLWKKYNEKGYLFYTDAMDMYGDKLPTKEQFEELKQECEWEWTGREMKIIGPNGNSLIFPANGYKDCGGELYRYGEEGRYYSSTPYYAERITAYHLTISEREFSVRGEGNRSFCKDYSIRLVKKNEYVDLGLPSGTLWKRENENGFYTYRQAVSKYNRKLPTKEQWQELKEYCTWIWTGNGYNIIGQNGNTMTLPALGDVDLRYNEVRNAGESGYYLYDHPETDESKFYFMFLAPDTYFLSSMGDSFGPRAFSLRLVR